MEEVAFINIGGVKFTILWNTLLERLPNTRLAKLREAKNLDEILKLCDEYRDNEYFFDRNPYSFTFIMNLIETGKLHFENECVFAIQEDFDYWDINESFLDTCCQQKYIQKKQDIFQEIQIRKEALIELKYEFKGCCRRLKSKV